MDPTLKQAIIDHFVHNFKETTNVYQFAERRIYEIKEVFRAIADEEKKPVARPIDNRPSSDHTREVQIKLDKLNRKDDT